ncbi:hypothetical protein B0H10DRAFT_2200381, partial [Mycena sp. CBHHK59/15]
PRLGLCKQDFGPTAQRLSPARPDAPPSLCPQKSCIQLSNRLNHPFPHPFPSLEHLLQ